MPCRTDQRHHDSKTSPCRPDLPSVRLDSQNSCGRRAVRGRRRLQGGNVWEWNEAILNEATRGLRGGSFSGGYSDEALLASYRYDWGDAAPTLECYLVAFRVSEVPEPSTMAILTLGGIGMLLRRRGSYTAAEVRAA